MRGAWPRSCTPASARGASDAVRGELARATAARLPRVEHVAARADGAAGRGSAAHLAAVLRRAVRAAVAGDDDDPEPRTRHSDIAGAPARVVRGVPDLDLDRAVGPRRARLPISHTSTDSRRPGSARSCQPPRSATRWRSWPQASRSTATGRASRSCSGASPPASCSRSVATRRASRRSAVCLLLSGVAGSLISVAGTVSVFHGFPRGAAWRGARRASDVGRGGRTRRRRSRCPASRPSNGIGFALLAAAS